MKTPRILPLAAVAVGGVLAAKALGAADGLPALLEQASAPAAHAAAPPPKPEPKPAERSPKPGGAPGASAPGVCAPTAAELAKEAGLSPAELQMLQSLGARRGQLDAREQALDAQMQLLAAAEAKVDSKVKAMNALKDQVQALLGQADQKTEDQVDKLVTVYEKMKPRDAGAIMATLDDKVRVPVAAKIAADKPAVMAAILSGMGTMEAKKLTEALAHRYAAAREAADAMQNGLNKSTADASPGAKPTQVAEADAPKDGAARTGAPATAGAVADAAPAKPAARPARRARPRGKASTTAKASPGAAAPPPAKAAAGASAPAGAAPAASGGGKPG